MNYVVTQIRSRNTALGFLAVQIGAADTDPEDYQLLENIALEVGAA